MAAGTFLRLPSIRGGVSSGGAVPPELSVHLSAAAGPSGCQPPCGSRFTRGLQWSCPKLRFPYPACFLSPCFPLALPPGCQPPFRGLIAPFGYLPKVRKSNDLTRFFQSFVREMRFSSRALLSVDRTARGELFDVEGSVGFRLRRLRCEARCGAESSVGCEPFGVAAARDNACSGRFFGDCPAGEAPCPRDFFGVCNEVADS